MDAIWSRLPDRTLTVALLRRGTIIWFPAHAMVVLLPMLSGAGPTAHPLTVTPRTALCLIVLVPLLGLLETRRLHEHRFMANLGVSQQVIVAILMIPAIAAEVIMAAIPFL